MSSSGRGQGCPIIDVINPALPLPTIASPILQGALKDGFGDSVVARDMPEPCEFLSLDSCQERFLWAQKEVDLVPYPVTELQVGDVVKFPHYIHMSFPICHYTYVFALTKFCFSNQTSDRSTLTTATTTTKLPRKNGR